MRLDIMPIRAVSGEAIPFDYELDLSGLELYGEYPFVNPVRMSGYVVNHAGMLELHAEAETVVKVRCARCDKEYEKEKIRVSLRAKTKGDVAEIASRLGGGGHTKAAGCTIYKPIEEAAKMVENEMLRSIGKLNDYDHD